MPSGKAPVTPARSSPPLPRGGGMASGVRSVEQDDAEEGDGRKGKGGVGDGESGLVEIDTLRRCDFNRWLVTEQNWAVAETVRTQRAEGETVRRLQTTASRERRHV
jgi:hypothetical protein